MTKKSTTNENGFQKKTWKTPKNQMKRAEQLKEQYYYEKQHKKDD